MNLLDLVPRWVWAVLVASLTATSFWLRLENAQLSIEIEKGKSYVSQIETAVAESNAAAAKKATELATQARQAEASAAVRERTLRADASAARTQLERLSHAASSYSLSRRASTLAPELDAPDLFPELFLQCSSRLVEVAGEADQWRSDAIKLYEAWPRE